jgi:hypothetical protein
LYGDWGEVMKPDKIEEGILQQECQTKSNTIFVAPGLAYYRVGQAGYLGAVQNTHERSSK